MIHTIAKTYSIAKSKASKFTEFDFWEMLAYENLESKKEEYLMKQNSES
jgi:hypothetical protein